MNPQAFRHKLECAVEERDQLALAELEKVAADSPVTKRIWNDHLLIEKAIERWRNIEPTHATWSTAATSSPATLTPETSRGVVISTAQPNRSPSSWTARGTLVALLFFVVGAVWSFSDRDPASAISLAESSALPASVSGVSEERLIELVALTDSPVSLMATYSSRVNPALFPGYSLVLTDQGRLLLPAQILPAFPEVTVDWEERMISTLDALASLPTEVQQAWERFSSPDLKADPTQFGFPSRSAPALPEELLQPGFCNSLGNMSFA